MTVFSEISWVFSFCLDETVSVNSIEQFAYDINGEKVDIDQLLRLCEGIK